MKYRRLGNSGLLVPEISLGLWHNFGANDCYDTARDIVTTAFDNGITYFDLANNYGTPAGSAEITFGKILKNELQNHRNKLLISSKAGHFMWDGPYGDGGSRKHIIASCDESLKRVGVDYFDIFYHHRPDPETPIAETVNALAYLVKSGRALYIGLSKYPPQLLKQAAAMLREQNVPVVVHQLKYSLLHREPEEQLFELHKQLELGCVSFSPLAAGQLTDRYAGGDIPADSRAAKSNFLKPEEVRQNLPQVQKLKLEAEKRGFTLSQYALKWQLEQPNISSVIVGASSTKQLIQNIQSTQ